MGIFSFSSVRARLILLVFLVLVPIAIMTVFHAWEEKRRDVKHATAQAEVIFNFAVLNEQKNLLETEEILEGLAKSTEVAMGGGECSSYLSSFLKNYPRYINIGVARHNGDVVCSAISYQKAPNIADRLYFRRALESGSFSIGEYQVGRITGKPSINFGYPVLDRKGKVSGVIFAAVDLSHVTEFEFNVTAQMPEGSTYIRLDSKGSVLSSYPSSLLFGGGNPLEKSFFEKISKERKGTFAATGTDGVERMYLFSTVWGAIYGEESYVLLGIPAKALFAESERIEARNLAVLGMVAALAILGMWIAGGKLIAEPVGVLVDASKRLAAGDLTARSGLSPTHGELGQLGHAFDEMAGELERKTNERKDAERRISRGHKMLAGLHAIDQKIIEGANIEGILQKICDTVVEIGYPMCWVGLAEPDHTVRIAAVRGIEKGSLEDLGPRWDDSPKGRGASGTVIKTGQTYVSRNLLEDDRISPWKNHIIAMGIRSTVSLPLKPKGDRVLGALNVYSDRENGFSPEDIRDLEAFSQQCNVAFFSTRNLDELRGAYQRLAFHFHRMPLGYILHDQDYRIVEWNPAAERIFGWSADEAVGKHPFELIVPQEMQAHLSGIWSKLRDGDDSVGDSAGPALRKDGTTATCEWFSTPLRDASGAMTGLITLVHDITEKTELGRQLQTAQRMEAVGTLAGGIAHDFNNVLTGVFGFGEILRSQLAGNEDALSNLDEMLRCGERAATLTRQLLTYSRRQIIETINLSLNTVITEFLKLVSKVVGEQIEIRTFLAKDLPIIRADVGQIEQVVMNLVMNARDAMPGGGQLTIETEVANLEAEYVRRHPYMHIGSYVLLTVSDTGIGMDQKTQEKVFEPFFTTKAPDKGSGLGLPMVYGIVKQHNGFIHLYSEPGKGTAFKIYLPPAEGAPEIIALARPSEIQGGTETILLAEDDESVRMLVERTLGDLGYTVLVTRNGEDAVEIFNQNSDKISLALLDIVMPLKGGKEAYEVMHQMKPGLKVIFMSGYTANSVHESFVLVAGVPFLSKPFGPGALARKVREVLDR